MNLPENAERNQTCADLMRRARQAHVVEFAITRHDRVTCDHHPEWEDNYPFEWRHNGVRIEIERARELLPY